MNDEGNPWDEDVPLFREWPWSRRWHHHDVGRTDSPPPIDLQGVYLPPEPVAAPPPPPTPTRKPVLDLVVVCEDGATLAGVRVRVRDDYDYDQVHETDDQGQIRAELELEAPHEISLDAIVDLRDVAALDPPVTLPSDTVRIRRDDQRAYRHAIDRAVTIAIVRDRAELVSLDGWAEGRKVLVFGDAHGDELGNMVTVRGIFRAALAPVPLGLVCVLGHADTKGHGNDNVELAHERANSVALYLAGKRDAWAQHAFANADVATLQAALAWAARAGVPCDPGPVDNDWGPATAAGLAGLRDHVGIPQTQPLGEDDWAAIFDLYDLELAKLLYVSPEALRTVKSNLYVVQDSFGEKWPAVAPSKDSWSCPANRRVDIVHCPPFGEPLEGYEEIYDGTFVVKHHAVAPEVTVKIRAVQVGTLVPVGMAVLDMVIGPGLRGNFVADREGLVVFTALRGDPWQVLGCTDLWSSSVYLFGLSTDMLPGGTP